MLITCFVSINIFSNASGESVSLLHGTGNKHTFKGGASIYIMEDKNKKEVTVTYKEFPYYEIGSEGSIICINRHNGKKKKMKQYDQRGYRYVFLFYDGKRFKKTTHRLVAQHFIPNPENKPQINHKNGVRSDNRVENLEWATSKENIRHSFDCNGRKMSEYQKMKIGDSGRGSKNHKTTLTESIVREILIMLSKKVKRKEICKTFHASKSVVAHIAQRRSWKHVTI